MKLFIASLILVFVFVNADAQTDKITDSQKLNSTNKPKYEMKQYWFV